MKRVLGAISGAFIILYWISSTFLPLGYWLMSSIPVAGILFSVGLIALLAFTLFVLILWIVTIFTERVIPVIGKKDWLVIHKIFLEIERVWLPLTFVAIFFYAVQVAKSPRMFDAALLAFWFEVMWVGFIYGGRQIRNYLGMEYRGYEFASAAGVPAFAALSNACFKCNDPVQGISYLLNSLEMTRAYLDSSNLKSEELDRSIVTLRLIHEIVSRESSEAYINRLRTLAGDLSNKDFQDILPYLPTLKVFLSAPMELAWTKSFKAVERKISLGTAISILLTVIVALGSFLSEQVKNTLFNWLAAVGSPEFIASTVDIAFLFLGYPYIDGYLTRAPVRYSDLKLLT